MPSPESKIVRALARTVGLAGLVALLVLSLGCGSAADRDTEKLKMEDPAGFTAVQRMLDKVANSRSLTADEVRQAKDLHQKYPAAPEVRKVLLGALQSGGDWTGVAALIEELPANKRARDDQLLLAKAYVRLGRNDDAAATAGPLADANPSDVELNSWAGQAWFNLGDHARAAAAFDRVWAGLIAAQQTDAIVDRGLIYFYQGAHPKAIEVLKAALAIDADSIPANSALARVYGAAGDQAQATIYQQKADEIHTRGTAEEARRMRLVALTRELEGALKEKRYGECVASAMKLIPQAPPAIQATAYQYLAQCYQAQGNTTEAQKATEQATRLQQQR